MADICVTVPKKLWDHWIAEGDAVGDPPTGEEWGFYAFGKKPDINPGERVYVVAHGKLRGYAPLTRLDWHPFNGSQSPNALGRVVFCRKGGAVAVTIKAPIRGFRGWMYRHWDRSLEIPFPTWKTEGVVIGRTS